MSTNQPLSNYLLSSTTDRLQAGNLDGAMTSWDSYVEHTGTGGPVADAQTLAGFTGARESWEAANGGDGAFLDAYRSHLTDSTDSTDSDFGVDGWAA